MAKRVYEPNADTAYSFAFANGKVLRLGAGETYETANEDEQRELDAQAAVPGSGLKVASKSKGGD